VPAGHEGGPVSELHALDCVPREVLLARTATRPLARDDRAALEDLATPDTPRLGPLDRAREALDTQRAVAAERLSHLEVGRRVGEPQVRVVLAARKIRTQLDIEVERGSRQRHLPVHLSFFLGWLILWIEPG
jgi:hypothetical protein